MICPGNPIHVYFVIEVHHRLQNDRVFDAWESIVVHILYHLSSRAALTISGRWPVDCNALAKRSLLG